MGGHHPGRDAFESTGIPPTRSKWSLLPRGKLTPPSKEMGQGFSSYFETFLESTKNPS